MTADQRSRRRGDDLTSTNGDLNNRTTDARCGARARFGKRFVFALGNADSRMTLTRVFEELNCPTSLPAESDVAFTRKLSSGKTKRRLKRFFF